MEASLDSPHAQGLPGSNFTMSDSFVVVTSSFPIRNDGSEAAGSFVADLTEELAKHVPLRVVAPGSLTQREQWSDRVQVFRYAAPGRALSTLKPWLPRDLAWIRRVLRDGAAATHEAAQGATHVLALWGLPCGEWARRAARSIGIDYSVWLLGSDVWSLGRVPILRGMLGRVIREARNAYGDGYKLAEDAQRIAGVPVAFLPSTRRIDFADPPPPRTQPPYRLLFLGRWHLNKGIDLLLDALLLLNDGDWQNIECVEIQGGGPLEPLVRERVAALQVAGRPVILGGFLAKPEAEAAIVRADWILIPSRIESIPVVFSDAVKLGRPVIATPVGDLPRLMKVDPGCGVPAEAASASAIAAALHVAVTSDSASYSPGLLKQATGFALTSVAQRLMQEVVRG